MAKVDLRGIWSLRHVGADRPEAPDEPLEAPVPGDVHSALLAKGLIPDPYWADNERRVQWVGQTDWEYRRTFEVDSKMLEAPSVYLNCDSLDTFAEIWINDQKVAETENMFLRYRLEVKPFLRPGENEIRIVLRSAENEALARSARVPYEIPHNSANFQIPHFNLIRKVACHSGWDWGIALMVLGIYGEIYLESVETARIDYVTTVQEHTQGVVRVHVTAEVESPRGGEADFQVRLGDVSVEKRVVLEPGSNVLTETVVIENPRLWWPNGYGDQPLYDLTVKVGDSRVEKRLGLRELELVTEEDEKGLSFRFRVNGVDIFAKGANWIPADALPSRQTRDVLDDLLTSAAEAHMNMLRVWGGGQYESDDFYDLCDEKGILIWQDFMFSCATYPATKEFLQLVRAEVVHQVKRLRDHACIALWCGNNECLGALNWFEVSRRNRDRYLVDYDRLYEGTIGQAVDEADPTRVYWPSSPSGGRGDYSDNWRDDRRGDMHYWRVWHENASFEAYYDVVPRFCSEFGYQSFPSVETVATFAPPNHWNPTAPSMEYHQRSGMGNSHITEMMTRYFRVPVGFDNFVYLSQVQQALAIKTGVEFWRTQRPVCMGTLYWQLNDVWPVCSWSSLEYGGKWKLLHYAAKRFYAPLMGTLQRKGDQLELWVVSDHTQEREIVADVTVMDFQGKVRFSDRVETRIGAGKAARVAIYDVAQLAPAPEEVFALASVRSGDEEHVNEYFFARYKQCELADASVQARVSQGEDGFIVHLETDAPAFFVSLEVPGVPGVFSDNAFTLVPGPGRAVFFRPKRATSLKEVADKLVVRHLRATY